MNAMTQCMTMLGLMMVMLGASVGQSAAQSWEFNTTSTEGWNPINSISNLHTSGGCLVGDIIGDDPYIGRGYDPEIDADANRFILIRMKIDRGNHAEFLWGTADDPTHKSGREVAFATIPDNQFHDYYVDMSVCPQWMGMVNHLRFDPSGLSSGHFEIDYIRLLSTAPPANLTVSVPSAEGRFAIVGEEFRVSATVHNDGYSDAANIQATLTVPGQTILTAQPLTTATISAGDKHTFQWTVRGDSVRISNMQVTITAATPSVTRTQTSVLVVSSPRPDLPTGAPAKAQSWTDASGNAVIENSKVRIACYNSPFGCGVSELYVRRDGSWHLAATASPVSRLTYRQTGGTDVSLALTPTVSTPSSTQGRAQLQLGFNTPDSDGGVWQGSITYELGDDDDFIKVRFTLSCTAQRELVVWYGPNLCPGNRSFGETKTQALFPGLEWLVESENSSNTLECAPGYNLRVSPHPYKITVPLMAVNSGSELIAMLWNPMQKWDGTNSYPCAVFSSPNWHEAQDNHLMGMFVPTIPNWVEENSTAASTPYSLAADKQLSMECYYLARRDADVLDAVEQWYAFFDLPALPGDGNLLESGMLTARNGFMRTMWNSTEKGWPMCIGWQDVYPYPEFIQDLFAHSLSEPSPYVKDSLRRRIGDAVQKAISLWGTVGLGSGAGSHLPDYRLPYYVGHLSDLASLMRSDAISLISSQQTDGGWFVSPYPDLAVPGTKELGSCAQNAYRLVRHARTTGHTPSRTAGLKALTYMNRFDVPRGYQVWEIPQHAPEILSAAWACAAYLEGYLLTGEESYLTKSKYWARAGLPFIYAWRASDRAIMNYGSVPAFGCTFWTVPWFGLPVQWEGLVYAYHIERLAEHDGSMPWRTIAEGITRSGVQQMNVSPYLGTLPDSINLIYDNEPNPVYINPDDIYKCSLKLLGGWGEVNIHKAVGQSKIARISSAARIDLACFNSADKQLTFRARYPASETSHILVFGTGYPASVYKGSAALDYAGDVDVVDEGWSYNWTIGCVVIKAVHNTEEQFLSIVTSGSFSAAQSVSGPAEARTLPEDTLVRFSGVVSAGTADFGRDIYVQTLDRSSGIRVSLAADPLSPISRGDLVEVMGSIATDNGERYIVNADAYRTGTVGVTGVVPLNMVNRELGGGGSGLQEGIVGSSGLTNLGLLITTSGKVTQFGDGYLYIDDGSDLRDGTSTGTEGNIGVGVICDPIGYGSGDHLQVIGISSCFQSPNGLARRILTRDAGDVRRMQDTQ